MCVPPHHSPSLDNLHVVQLVSIFVTRRSNVDFGLVLGQARLTQVAARRATAAGQLGLWGRQVRHHGVSTGRVGARRVDGLWVHLERRVATRRKVDLGVVMVVGGSPTHAGTAFAALAAANENRGQDERKNNDDKNQDGHEEDSGSAHGIVVVVVVIVCVGAGYRVPRDFDFTVRTVPSIFTLTSRMTAIAREKRE